MAFHNENFNYNRKNKGNFKMLKIGNRPSRTKFLSRQGNVKKIRYQRCSNETANNEKTFSRSHSRFDGSSERPHTTVGVKKY